jgi:hypothetical protein
MMSKRPSFVLRVRAEPHVTDVIRALRAWLKNGLRHHGLRCLSIEQERVTMDQIKRTMEVV